MNTIRKDHSRYMIIDRYDDRVWIYDINIWDTFEAAVVAAKEAEGMDAQCRPWTIVEATKVAGVYDDLTNDNTKIVKVSS